MRTWLPSVVLAASLAPSAARADDVSVSNAWIRALPGSLPAAAYFTVRNSGTRDITLSGASSAACGMLMLHKSSSANGMASMADVDSVDIHPGGVTRFEPGGLHLMCMDPKRLEPGGRVAITLQFANGKRVTTSFVVRNARGK